MPENTHSRRTHSLGSPEHYEEHFESTPLDSMGKILHRDDVLEERRKPNHGSLASIFANSVISSYGQSVPKALYTSCAILSYSLNTWVHCLALAVNSVYRIAYSRKLYDALTGYFLRHSQKATTSPGFLTKVHKVAVKILLAPILFTSAIVLTLTSVITIAMGAIISVIVPAVSPMFIAVFALQSLLCVIGNTLTAFNEAYTLVRDRVLEATRDDERDPDAPLDSTQRAKTFIKSLFRQVAASMCGVTTAVFLMPIEFCLSLPSVAIPPSFGALLTPIVFTSSIFNIESINKIFCNMSTLVNPKSVIKFGEAELLTEDVDEIDLILKIQGISSSSLHSTYKKLRTSGDERKFYESTGCYEKHLGALRTKVSQLRLAVAMTIQKLGYIEDVCKKEGNTITELEVELSAMSADNSTVFRQKKDALEQVKASLDAHMKSLEELSVKRDYLEYKIFKAELRILSVNSAGAVLRKNRQERIFLEAEREVSALIPSVETAMLKSAMAAGSVIVQEDALLKASVNVNTASRDLAYAQSQFYTAKNALDAANTASRQLEEAATETEKKPVDAQLMQAQKDYAHAEKVFNSAKENLSTAEGDLEQVRKTVAASTAEKHSADIVEQEVVARYLTALRKRDTEARELEKSRVEEYTSKIHMYDLIEVRDVRDISGIRRSTTPLTEREKKFVEECRAIASEELSHASVAIDTLSGRLESPECYDAMILEHRKNVLLPKIAIHGKAQNPEGTSILNARRALLSATVKEHDLKSAEMYYKSSLKALSDADTRSHIYVSDPALHAYNAEMAHMKVADSRALYNLSLKEKQAEEARSKVKQCTETQDLLVKIADSKSYIASAASSDLAFLCAAMPEDKEEISIAADRVKVATHEAEAATQFVEQNAARLEEAKLELSSVESTLYDAKRKYLDTSHALKAMLIEQNRAALHPSESSKSALDETYVLTSDPTLEQTMSAICAFLCSPYEHDTYPSSLEEVRETCNDLAESMQKKRDILDAAHHRVHDSERKFLLYVQSKARNDFEYAQSKQALAQEYGLSEHGELSDDPSALSIDLERAAAMAISALQVLDDQISESHDICSYHLSTQRMIPTAYEEIAQLRRESLTAPTSTEESYDSSTHKLISARAKLSKLAARHCSDKIKECILRYKYENTQQLKSLASSNAEKIFSIASLDKAREGETTGLLRSDICETNIKDYTILLHDSAFTLHEVTNLIRTTCSFSDSITDTVEEACTQLQNASTACSVAKKELINALEEDKPSAEAVYIAAVRKLKLQTAYHDKIMSECNMVHCLAGLLSAAHNAAAAKRAFSRHEKNGIKDLLVTRAEAELHMANARFSVSQQAYRKKSAEWDLVRSSSEFDTVNDFCNKVEQEVLECKHAVSALNNAPSCDEVELESAVTALEDALKKAAHAKSSVVSAHAAKAEAELLLADANNAYEKIKASSNSVISMANRLHNHVIGLIRNKVSRSSNPELLQELGGILDSVPAGSINTSETKHEPQLTEVTRGSSPELLRELGSILDNVPSSVGTQNVPSSVGTQSEPEHELQPAEDDDVAQSTLKLLEANLRIASASQYVTISEIEVQHKTKSLRKKEEDLLGVATEEYGVNDVIHLRSSLAISKAKHAHASAEKHAAESYYSFVEALNNVVKVERDEQRVHGDISSSKEEKRDASTTLAIARFNGKIHKIFLDMAEADKNAALASLERHVASEILKRTVEKKFKVVGCDRANQEDKTYISDAIKKYKDEDTNAQIRGELSTLEHELATTALAILKAETESYRVSHEIDNLNTMLEKEFQFSYGMTEDDVKGRLSRAEVIKSDRFNAEFRLRSSTSSLKNLQEKFDALQKQIEDMSSKVPDSGTIFKILHNVGITKSLDGAYSVLPFKNFQEFSLFTSDKFFIPTGDDYLSTIEAKQRTREQEKEERDEGKARTKAASTIQTKGIDLDAYIAAAESMLKSKAPLSRPSSYEDGAGIEAKPDQGDAKFASPLGVTQEALREMYKRVTAGSNSGTHLAENEYLDISGECQAVTQKALREIYKATIADLTSSTRLAENEYLDISGKYHAAKSAYQSMLASTATSERKNIARTNLEKLSNDLKLQTARKTLAYWNNEVFNRSAAVHSAYLAYSNSKIGAAKKGSPRIDHADTDDENNLNASRCFTVLEDAKNSLALANAQKNLASIETEIATIAQELAVSRISYDTVHQEDSTALPAVKESAHNLLVHSEKKLELAEKSKTVALTKLKETIAYINLKKAKIAYKYTFLKQSRTPEEEENAEHSLACAEKELKVAKENRILAYRKFALCSADFSVYKALRALDDAEDHHRYVLTNPLSHTDKDRDKATTALNQAKHRVEVARKDRNIESARLRENYISEEKLEDSERDLRLTKLDKSLIERESLINTLTEVLDRSRDEYEQAKQHAKAPIKAEIDNIERKLRTVSCERFHISSEINLLRALKAFKDAKAFHEYVYSSSAYSLEEKRNTTNKLEEAAIEVEFAKIQKSMRDVELKLLRIRDDILEAETQNIAQGGTASKAIIAKYDEDVALSELEILKFEREILNATTRKKKLEDIKRSIYESETCTTREKLIIDQDLRAANDFLEFAVVSKNIAEESLAVLKATKNLKMAQETKGTIKVLKEAENALKISVFREQTAHAELDFLTHADFTGQELEYVLNCTNTQYLEDMNFALLHKALSSYAELKLSCMRKAFVNKEPGGYSFDNALKNLVNDTYARITHEASKRRSLDMALENTIRTLDSTHAEAQLAIGKRAILHAEEEQANSELLLIEAFDKLNKVHKCYDSREMCIQLSQYGTTTINSDKKVAVDEFKIAICRKETADASLEAARAYMEVLEAAKHLDDIREKNTKNVHIHADGKLAKDLVEAAEEELNIAKARNSVASAKHTAALINLRAISNFLHKNEVCDASVNEARLSETAASVAVARLNTMVSHVTLSELTSSHAQYDRDISVLNEEREKNITLINRITEELEAAKALEATAQAKLKNLTGTEVPIQSDVKLEAHRSESGIIPQQSAIHADAKPEKSHQKIAREIPILFCSVKNVALGPNKVTDADLLRALGDIANRRSLVLAASKNKKKLGEERKLIYESKSSTTGSKISIDRDLSDATAALELAIASKDIAEIKLEILKAAKALKIVKDPKKIPPMDDLMGTTSTEYDPAAEDALKLAILSASVVENRLKVSLAQKDLIDASRADSRVSGSGDNGLAKLCRDAAEADLALFSATRAYKKAGDEKKSVVEEKSSTSEEIYRVVENSKHKESELELAESKKNRVDEAIAFFITEETSRTLAEHENAITTYNIIGAQQNSKNDSVSPQKIHAHTQELEERVELAKLQEDAAKTDLALFHAIRALKKATAASKSEGEIESGSTEKRSDAEEHIKLRKTEVELMEAKKTSIDSSIALLNARTALEEAKSDLNLIKAGIRLPFDKVHAQKELDNRAQQVKLAEAHRDASHARYKILEISVRKLPEPQSRLASVSDKLCTVVENQDASFVKLKSAKYELEINKKKSVITELELAILKAKSGIQEGADNSASSSGPLAEKGHHTAESHDSTNGLLQSLTLQMEVAKAELAVLEATYDRTVIEDKYLAAHKSSLTSREKSNIYQLLIETIHEVQLARAIRNYRASNLAVFNAEQALQEAKLTTTGSAISSAEHALEHAKTDQRVANRKLRILQRRNAAEAHGEGVEKHDESQPDNSAVPIESHAAEPDTAFNKVDYMRHYLSLKDNAYATIENFMEHDDEEESSASIYKTIAEAELAVLEAAAKLKEAEDIEEFFMEKAERKHNARKNLRFAELKKEIADVELEIFNATVALKCAMENDKSVSAAYSSTPEEKSSSELALNKARTALRIADLKKEIAEVKLEILRETDIIKEAEGHYAHLRNVYKNSPADSINLATAYSELQDAHWRLNLSKARQTVAETSLEVLNATNELYSTSAHHKRVTDSQQPSVHSGEILKPQISPENAKLKCYIAKQAQSAAIKELHSVVRMSETQDNLPYPTPEHSVVSSINTDTSQCIKTTKSPNISDRCAQLTNAALPDKCKTFTSMWSDVKVEQVAHLFTQKGGTSTASKN